MKMKHKRWKFTQNHARDIPFYIPKFGKIFSFGHPTPHRYTDGWTLVWSSPRWCQMSPVSMAIMTRAIQLTWSYITGGWKPQNHS